MSLEMQEELFQPRVLFADRDKTKDRSLLIDKLIEQFKKTGKIDLEKPFGYHHYLLDIAEMIFGIPEDVTSFAQWHGYTADQFCYARELWDGLGTFFFDWWQKNKP